MIDYAILALKVTYVALMVIFGVLVLTESIEPLHAGVLGLTACVLALSWHLMRRWDRKNRAKYLRA